MTPGTVLFFGLLAHFWGDYCLQNHWMANNKTKPEGSGFLACTLHAVLYTVPFLVVALVAGVTTPHLWAGLLIIGGTHWAIDRHRLAAGWCEFWGVGAFGSVPGATARLLGWEHNPNTGKWAKDVVVAEHPVYGISKTETQFFEAPDAPPWLKTWLIIIVDNTWHLTINSTVILLWMASA
jgi:hypothetical protein